MKRQIFLCSHLQEEICHGHFVFVGSSENAELFVMAFGQSENAFDVLLFILHVIDLIVGAHQSYGMCAFLKCRVKLSDIVCCSDLHNLYLLS